MKKEVLLIFINQCRKNKIAVVILVMICVAIGVVSPIIAKFMDSTSFYLSNSKYNILLSNVPANTCENEAYYIKNDFVLLKQGKVIDAQGIMLKENSDYSSTFNIKSLSQNELIVTKKIAIDNNIVVGSYIDIELNYKHKVAQYKVVGIYDYLFDITQDVNIGGSPMFFVGYDEAYIENSILTYLSFYNNATEISTIISVESIVEIYRCKSRAVMCGFVFVLLTVVSVVIVLVGYFLFSKTLEKKTVLSIIRNSGTTLRTYRRFVLSFNCVSTLVYCLPLVLLTIIGCVFSIKYLFYIATVLVFMSIYQVIENYLAYKNINFLGANNDHNK